MAASRKRFTTEEVVDFFREDNLVNEDIPNLDETFNKYVGVVVETDDEMDCQEDLPSDSDNDCDLDDVPSPVSSESEEVFDEHEVTSKSLQGVNGVSGIKDIPERLCSMDYDGGDLLEVAESSNHDKAAEGSSYDSDPIKTVQGSSQQNISDLPEEIQDKVEVVCNVVDPYDISDTSESSQADTSDDGVDTILDDQVDTCTSSSAEEQDSDVSTDLRLINRGRGRGRSRGAGGGRGAERGRSAGGGRGRSRGAGQGRGAGGGRGRGRGLGNPSGHRVVSYMDLIPSDAKLISVRDEDFSTWNAFSPQ